MKLALCLSSHKRKNFNKLTGQRSFCFFKLGLFETLFSHPWEVNMCLHSHQSNGYGNLNIVLHGSLNPSWPNSKRKKKFKQRKKVSAYRGGKHCLCSSLLTSQLNRRWASDCLHCEVYCFYWTRSKCFLFSTWIKACSVQRYSLVQCT